MLKLRNILFAVSAAVVSVVACAVEDMDGDDNSGELPPQDNTPEEIVINLDFKKEWPFNEECVAASVQENTGEAYTYTHEYMAGADSVSMTLDFMISRGTTSTSLDYSYTDGALYFNSTGTNNGMIKLPGIEGYYLNRVDARHVSAERSRFALMENFSNESGERLLAGWATTGALTIFWMPVTETLASSQQPGQSFTLQMRDKYMKVTEIRLVYTKTKPEGEPPMDVSGVHLYAHRGKWSKDGSDYFVPENSLTGVQMAALMGYEGIECDVKYTKDKVMVVMHDATINKTMRNALDYSELKENVKVADLTFEQLRRDYVFESTEPAFRLKCPTLEEILLECKRCGIRPMLHSSIYESYEMAQRIMGDDWVCFTGAGFDNVLRVRSELKSKCTILWSISKGFDTVETQLEQIGGDCGISSMESGYYTKEMIDRLRGADYHVQCSIFPSGEERLAIENGVDYVLTDRVLPEGARTDITAEEILKAYPPVPSFGNEGFDHEGGAYIPLNPDGGIAKEQIRVGILGDSISTFEDCMCNPDYKEWYPKSDPNVGKAGKEGIAVDSVRKLWWWRLINEYMDNGVLDANSSWSGTRVRSGVETEGYSGKKYQAGFVNRTGDFNDPDVIIIFGGTNDTTKDKGALLGDYEWDSSVGSHNTGEFRSAYVCMIKKLQEAYEGVQLILVIGDKLTQEYEQSIIEIARHFDLPYVNFVGDSAKLPKCATVHPDATGHRYLAEKIFTTCKEYLTR